MNIKTNKFYYFILGAVCTLLVSIVFGSFFSTGTGIPFANSSPDNELYRVIPPHVPERIEFAGEKVPTDNFEVYERMEREFLSNAFWHSATFLALKRSARWFPVIEPILKKYNIPDDFKFLAVAESNLDNVVSPVGASGFWQFMEATGKKYGLEINDQIDERYHVEKATEAACKYLLDSYSIVGSWTAAAASYNMGQEGIKRQQQKQRSKNYYNLVLNQETYRFVGRIVSLKYILSNPAAYGFIISENERYKPFRYKEIKLTSPVSDFAEFAEKNGINYITLKLYNPWLRDNNLKNKEGRTYVIKIPE